MTLPRAPLVQRPRRALRTAIAAAAVLVAPLAPPPALAQTSDLFRSDAIFGERIRPPSAPANDTVAALARCLADPADRVSCHLARERVVGMGLETVTWDLDGKDGALLRSDPDAGTSPGRRADPAAGGALRMVEAEVLFEYNSTAFAGGEDAKVGTLAAALAHPATVGTTFLLLGHTDAVGSHRYNCVLSRRRAAALAEALANAGVARERLIAVGVGETMLKLPQDPRAAANRRVGFGPLADGGAGTVVRLEALCR